ncbi:MAG: prepilin peptidase [Candidatus Pacebacteria bacterium]|nr:prepilin peptidase [Candidatus Paceibacterota bacterium]
MILTYFIVLLFGFCCGSFLNCVIYRLEKRKSFVCGRSFCPKCKHTLAWYDLIPILSFIVQKARCRYCHKKISWQYPIVEISTGLILFFIFYFLFFNHFLFSIFYLTEFLFLAIISCLLIVIFAYDLKHFIIPDKAIYPAIIFVFLGRLFGFLNFEHWNLFGNSDLGFRIFKNLKMPLVAGLSAGVFFFLIWLVSRGRWMGFGDVKLAFLLGLFLGWPNILVGLFFAFLTGSIAGLFLIVLKKKKMKSEVPFGPFLVIGTFIGLFWGEKIIHWYLSFLL